MAPNSENPLSLLLFAILDQKSLKDIDWERVAKHECLSESISNGHAARMRFFRFRASVQEKSPKPRLEQSAGGRVTKSKPKKQQQQRAKRDSLIKSEMDPSVAAFAQFSPASTTSPYLGDAMDDFSDRFTPFSDDMSAHTGGRNSLTIEPTVAQNFPPLPMDGGGNYANAAGSAFDDAFGLTATGLLHSTNSLDVLDTQHLNDFTPDWTNPFQ